MGSARRRTSQSPIEGTGSEPKARQGRPAARAFARDSKPKAKTARSANQASRMARARRDQTKNSNPGKTSAVSTPAGEEETETLRSLNTKLNASYENWYAQLSPRTRAAWKEYRRLEALDREEGYLCYDDPEHELYQDPEAQWDEVDETMPLPSPERGTGEAEGERVEDDGPRCRTIKDEGWD